MTSLISENRTASQVRSYERAQSIVFLKTKEAFGGLSNMAGGFPLRVNGIRIFTSEALYQACRFPHLPDVQRIVLDEPSPMTSKMKTKPYRQNSRPDWDQVRVRVMRWCLRVKLVQNWKAFGDLLLATDDKPIVEESRKDDFWGANSVDEHTLVGMNVLGRLLMELREEFKSDRRDALLKVDPLPISDFLLMGQPIPAIEALAQDSKRLTPSTDASMKSVGQPSLFDQPALFDAKTVTVPMHEVNEQMPQIYANSYLAITNLQPYPEYKESGLPWLGRMPGHWGLTPNRGLIQRRKVLVGDRHQGYQLLSLTKSGVIVRDITSGKGKFSSDMGTSQEVRDGDLVFCLFDVPETPRTVGLSRHNGMITGAYTVFECANPKLAEYFEIFYRAMDDRKLLSPLYSGLRNTIRPERFLGTKTPQPPPNEQAAIVRFLAHATHQLDKAMRAKRKTIALLNEQKQAIIHRAVTRGLDPDMPLKDSGIPWLGQIPAHWEVRRLKSFVSNVTDQTTTMSADEMYIALENVESWSGRVKPQRKQNEALFTGQVKKFQTNDVLFGKLRPYLAKVITASSPGVCVGEFFVLRANGAFVSSLFLEQLLRTTTTIDVINSSTFGAKMPRADWQFVGNLRFALPSVSEQKAVVESIYLSTKPPTITISRIEREIELLREYRTRLVADVVTGKLDVREAAARLPELEGAPADEPEVAEMEETIDDLAGEVA